MMKSLFKSIVLLLFIPCIAVAHNGPLNGKYTKEKTIKKEFSVNADAALNVSNSYGNLEITTWNENRTVIEVHIVTNGDNEEKVQQKLDEITVEFSANASLVTAVTKFKNRKSSWSLFGSKNNNVHMKINYTIKLPVTNTVDLDNDYGTITLNKLEGKAKISCDYGQLIIGELLADNNSLNFDYTNKSTISYMKSGKINADYSGFNLEKAGTLELNADYTTSRIEEVADLNYNCDYGTVEIDKGVNIVGRGDYVSNRFGILNGSLDLTNNYGSIVVGKLSGSSNNVTIKAEFTGIKLGFESNYNFNFTLDLKNASFKGEEHVTLENSVKEKSHKLYSGYHGSQNSGNKVFINSNYGNVTFKKN